MERSERHAVAATTDLVANTPDGRNRAVDFYRAAAMCVVAVGHWLGMVVVIGEGGLDGGNLLEWAPGYGWVTWIAQVMPLFFFVGGFASANSLRSSERKGHRPADWVATRLHRMVAPTAVLASFWAFALLAGALLGGWGIVSIGASAAAIPLWFLANYTIDTALAPFTFRWFRIRRLRLLSGLGALFAVGEAARFADLPVLPQVNWVVGWLLFQVAGFAWAERRLPAGKALWSLAAAFWATAVGAVWLGPWPAVMLHHGGLEHSPTHPPSSAFVLFGFSYCLTAAALAPSLTRWLERSERAWRATIAANAISMSVYLWHMTAAVAVAAIAYAVGLIPSSEPGTTAWWFAKLPFLLANAAVLVPIVLRVAPVEQRALLSGGMKWRWGTASMLLTAGFLSVSVKTWSSPQAPMVVLGLAGTLAVWHLFLSPARRRPPVDSVG